MFPATRIVAGVGVPQITAIANATAALDMALLAISIARERCNRLPDLLVSGINDQANLGAVVQVSSTVGASIVALASM